MYYHPWRHFLGFRLTSLAAFLYFLYAVVMVNMMRMIMAVMVINSHSDHGSLEMARMNMVTVISSSFPHDQKNAQMAEND